ncbi:flagellar basal body-associated FliL family protein [bacterium]|nr:flagellar basal body-associated FliL family protein [bacterium]
MAKPNNTKEIKPKENEELVKVPLDNNLKLVLINITSTILICILLIGVNYILQENLLNKKFETIANSQESENGDVEGEDEEVQKGIILDLGDFILNLNDPSQKRYLKVNVSLELSRTPNDPDFSNSAAEGKKEGHGASGADDAMSKLEHEMNQYKPAIRDSVILNFSSKTADEVSTAAGKELVKEQITEDVNAIFAGEREVLRVNFGQFIIQ